MAMALMKKCANSYRILFVQVISKLGFSKEAVVTTEAGNNNAARDIVSREHANEAKIVTNIQVGIVTVPVIIHAKINGKSGFKSMVSSTFHFNIILIPYTF